MFNRRALLAAIGLTLPAFAVAEAATTKKKVVKKPGSHGPKVASHKPTRKPGKPTPAAQG
jgi:hypothetical protein